MEKRIERENYHLFYEKEGTGPLLILIHGVACDHTYFKKAVVFLKRHFTVITFDRRGYSESTLTETYTEQQTDHSVNAQAEDVLFLIKEQKMGPAFLIGCSAGGIVALEAARINPMSVKGLVLQESPIAGEESTREQLAELKRELQEAFRKKQMNRALLLLQKRMGGMDKRAKSKSLELQLQDILNFRIFLEKELEIFLGYDLVPLSVPCVVAIGECDETGLFHQVAKKTAEIMGWPLVRTPGYHNFPADLPYEFAVMVRGLYADITSDI